MDATSARPDAAGQRDALIERIVAAVLNLWDVYAIYLGDQLGLYARLREVGAATSTRLAADLGLAERYVREWLEQQAAVGILTVENPGDGWDSRRFSLSEGHAEVLAEPESLNFLTPLAQIAIGAVSPIHAVMEAYRNGGGVPYADYGRDLIEGQARINRNMFLYRLGQEYLPAISDLHARLTADPPARIADFGCGYAWSTIGMARAYPNALVDGFDLDDASVAAAEANVREAGLTNRVTIRKQNAADPALAGRYDLVTAFECLHDMSDPVGALRTMRRLTVSGGTVLIMDEKVGEHFAPIAGDVERMNYGFSIVHCLPVGMVDQPSAGTGAVMRVDTFRGYADAAGFASVEILPIENDSFNFYRLT